MTNRRAWHEKCLAFWLPEWETSRIEALVSDLPSTLQGVPTYAMGNEIPAAFDEGLRLRLGTSVHDWHIYSKGAFQLLVEVYRRAGGQLPDVEGFAVCAEVTMPMKWLGAWPTTYERLSAYGACGNVFKRTRRDRYFCDSCRPAGNRPSRSSGISPHIADRRVERHGGELRVIWLGQCQSCRAEFEVETSTKARAPELCASCRSPKNRQRRRRGQEPKRATYRFHSGDRFRWSTFDRSFVAQGGESEWLEVPEGCAGYPGKLRFHRGGYFETDDAEIAGRMQRFGLIPVSLDKKSR